MTPPDPPGLNARVPEVLPPPADDAFAERLWRPAFVRQVRIASKSMIPMIIRSEHDDLIQEALIRAYKGRHTYNGSTDLDLLKWVLVILRNHSRDVADERSKEPQFEPLPVDSAAAKIDDPVNVPESHAGSKEEAGLPAAVTQWLATARGILGCLSPDDQEILKHRLGMGFSVGETARILGISEGAVKMRFHRAFQRIVALARKAKLTPGGPRTSGSQGPSSPAQEGDEEE